jgi:hypothetical protein
MEQTAKVVHRSAVQQHRHSSAEQPLHIANRGECWLANNTHAFGLYVCAQTCIQATTVQFWLLTGRGLPSAVCTLICHQLLWYLCAQCLQRDCLQVHPTRLQQACCCHVLYITAARRFSVVQLVERC